MEAKKATESTEAREAREVREAVEAMEAMETMEVMAPLRRRMLRRRLEAFYREKAPRKASDYNHITRIIALVAVEATVTERGNDGEHNDGQDGDHNRLGRTDRFKYFPFTDKFRTDTRRDTQRDTQRNGLINGRIGELGGRLEGSTWGERERSLFRLLRKKYGNYRRHIDEGT